MSIAKIAISKSRVFGSVNPEIHFAGHQKFKCTRQSFRRIFFFYDANDGRPKWSSFLVITTKKCRPKPGRRVERDFCKELSGVGVTSLGTRILLENITRTFSMDS